MSSNTKSRSKNRKSSYVPAPTIEEQHLPRYMVVMAAAMGRISMSEGAKRLGISRNHFQTLVHRSQAAVIEAVTPQLPGRKSRSEREVELEQQVAQLQRENAKLQDQAETSDRLLDVARQMLREKTRPTRRAQATRSKKTAKSLRGTGPDGEDPEPALRLQRAHEMKADGIPLELSAAAVGVGVSTLRRWRHRAARGLPPRRRRGPRPGARPASPELEQQVARRVRDLGGRVGAESLRLGFPGVSRRRAQAIKQATLTDMERARKASCGRVTVTVPGVVRGFDAMHLAGDEHRHYALIAADGCVPYRTTARSVDHYDGRSVLDVLTEDIEKNGAPLVLRLDRASCHKVGEVTDMLDEYGILALHGPAHYPRFYGQLERQNREHREWLDGVGVAPDDVDDDVLDAMKHALNDLWHRRTLGGTTAGEAWRQKPQLRENRAALRAEVDSLTARLERELVGHRDIAHRARRLAIQHALTTRGYLRCDEGRWC